MTDKDNKAASPKAALVESDYRETRMDYGDGKLPLYIAVCWGLMLLGYVGYMVVYAAPDLSVWGMP